MNKHNNENTKYKQQQLDARLRVQYSIFKISSKLVLIFVVIKYIIMIDITKIIYSTLPTPIYKVLSNQYHLFLSYCESIQSHDHYNVNVEQMNMALVIGISIGLGIVTFLNFFPGTSSRYLHGKSYIFSYFEGSTWLQC